ncbi:crotonobetaine/carnitine-CoA ligase [Thermocatellispora tengchongensis]|uniref:Crotonobetaine/carnitine-CoA ligase n=1 Tax=Thermocatellispora tengchongensis TaxID=1073253 RepID=A0A840PG06_9ACTN|nr:AMP-binding protein [Thermocatellispora tengchongensis]MBB5136077.1 crotonobetaine/carnitine-CoA ligase [Thermocatellispora tengchongensis]
MTGPITRAEPMAPDDHDIPDADACVLPRLLRRRAVATPDREFAVFEGGERWTYAEAWQVVLDTAGALRARGVAPGDRVLSWQPNGADALRTWLAVNQLGAVYVPLNTAYRGRLLEHVLTNSGARLMVVHPRLAERLDGLATARPELVLTPEELDAAGPAAEDCPAQPWDTYAIIYTSGTTGPSKGVLSSYVHVWSAAMAAFGGVLDEHDRYMVNLPLFHAGGTIGVTGALVLGGSIALVEGFRTDAFWPEIRRTGTTAVTLLGAMASFLRGRPPSPDDTAHPLRTVFMIPVSEDAEAFSQRFGVEIRTMFNMTETSCPLVSAAPNPPRGTCGKPRPGVEVRLVDEHDREVPPGAAGELIVRTARPWAMTHGYHDMPEATARAWRNGWFHTGDAFRRDERGDFVFVDRLKDAIRRRGENISSFEVETAVLEHPAVREAAAVAVPSEHGEDEILLVVAPVDDALIDPAELHEHCRARLPHFMIPRYVRVTAELPRTPTSKIEKHRLRRQGLTEDTWDREVHGLAVKRERLTR